MSSQTTLPGTWTAAEIKRLEADLARLEAYKAVAQCSLKLMGLSLEVAQEQGWMNKRPEVLRRQWEAKRISDAEKWANHHKYRKQSRAKYKPPELSVDKAPSSKSSITYRYRELIARFDQLEVAKSLRRRVRSTSYQLLIAAAMAKKYRQIAMADRSGKVTSGANSATPSQARMSNIHDKTNMSATEAIARAFRNWENGEKMIRLRPQSSAPEMSSDDSQTTDSDDTPSRRSGSSAMSVSDDENEGTHKSSGSGMPLNAIAFGATPDKHGLLEDDYMDTELTNLNPKDVTNEIMIAAYATLAATNAAERGNYDWADVLGNSLVMDVSQGTSSAIGGMGIAQLGTVANTNSSRSHNSQGTAADKMTNIGQEGVVDSRPHNAILMEKVKQARQFLGHGPDGKVHTSKKVAENHQENTHDDHVVWSGRQPNKPKAPDPSIYEPSRWLINIADADDGTWLSKEVLGRKDPADTMETGFITWDRQTSMFPSLQSHMEMRDVGAPHPLVYDPATVDSKPWDPINRMIAEPKVGTRQPLRLGPITTLSLSRWSAAHYGREYPVDPIRFPQEPKAEDKSRSLPSTSMATSSALKKDTGGGSGGLSKREGQNVGRRVRFAPVINTALASQAITDQQTPVASVHYPLKSPTATSISIPNQGKAGDIKENPNFSGFMAFSRAAYRPPTPYKPQFKGSAPGTPTVALYERPATPMPEPTKPATQYLDTENQQLGSSSSFNYDESQGPYDAYPATDATLFSVPHHYKKRPAELTDLPVRKRRASSTDDSISSSSESEKETTVAYSHYPLSSIQANLAATAAPKWVEEEEENRSIGDSDIDVDSDAMDVTPDDPDLASQAPPFETQISQIPPPQAPPPEDLASTVQALGLKATVMEVDDEDFVKPKSGGKSVRFDLGGEPSEGMKQEARRAVGRYNLTARRRGSFGPYR